MDRRQGFISRSRMGKATITIVISLLITSYKSAGKLIQVPRNTASKVNETTYFNCSTDLVAKDIFWYHGANLVYTGGDVYEGYDKRVKIEVNNATGACNLIIHSVQPSDAGEYKCWEDEGNKEKSSAELVVLDDDPICQSNIGLHDVIGQNACNLKRDDVNLSCSVTYHGNIPPRIEWKRTEDDINITGTISPVVSANTYTSTLILENGISLHNSAYVCQINGKTVNQYKCISEAIRLSYSVDRDEIVNAVRGTTLTCVANTTFKCRYRWFQGNDSVCPVSCSEHVTLKELGDYHCEAKCEVREKSCTFVAMKAFAFKDPEPVTERTYGSSALATIAVVSCLTCTSAAGVAIGLYLYHNPRKRPRNFEEAFTCLKFASEILVYASEKEKQEYIRKTGQDPSVLLISDGMMEALKQVHSMFPKKSTSRESKAKGSTPDDEASDRLLISQPGYCELPKVAEHESRDHTSIESGKDAT